MRYDALYYQNIYAGFEDPDFAARWATGCRVAAGIPERIAGKVVEFGAGLGQNLSVIQADEKWAVDINTTSQKSCTAQGFRWHGSVDQLPDGYFHLILSRHSLEHVPSPLEILTALHRKALPGGRFFLVVPYEGMDVPRCLDRQDEHAHLYAWSPMTIKNLLLEAGWRVQRVTVHNGLWFRRSLALLNLDPTLFRIFRSMVSRLLPLKSAEIAIECLKDGADA